MFMIEYTYIEGPLALGKHQPPARREEEKRRTYKGKRKKGRYVKEGRGARARYTNNNKKIK